jgi:hypothetical protein
MRRTGKKNMPEYRCCLAKGGKRGEKNWNKKKRKNGR